MSWGRGYDAVVRAGIFLKKDTGSDLGLATYF